MKQEKFIFLMIRPTHYDDEGYPLQWKKSFVPSNSVATVYGLAYDCKNRNILGQNVDIELMTIDETNEYVDRKRLVKHIRRTGAKALVGMIGVQTNQFPRAVDLSKSFLDAGIPVCIGGFHVSGCLSMLDEMPKDLKQAQQMGISFFAGEAEEQRLDEVLQDAYSGKLKPIYNHLNSMPTLERQPIPIIPKEQVEKTFYGYSSFDLGRGCPFDCSFCTIINVQGKKSRFRSADDVERIVRENHAFGIDKFFLTDDNFARNRNWEACLDRLIELREREGIKIRLMMQVDTVCHKIPHFIEKCCRAGAEEIFIGLETVNPVNLVDVGKRQNKVADYKEMILAWKRYPVLMVAGYIIGLPNDTKESILNDIEIIKNELAIDIVYLSMLTPLPGCEDHKKLTENGIWMDEDMNKYDLYHRVNHHPRMSDEEWEEAYKLSWEHFYSYEHMQTILRRMIALGSNKRITTVLRLTAFREFMLRHGVQAIDAGFFRIKRRKERRPGLPFEHPLVFYPKYFWEILYKCGSIFLTYFRLRRLLKTIVVDENSIYYTDSAITPLASSENDISVK